MAALYSGISYGLSQSSLNENKELIFVKLTDSAYRAIEDYLKNQSKLNSHPTIQFLGNEGYLSFPTATNHGGSKFSFSITEVEGPQGSFECIHQNQDQLDVLGPLSHKMRIHANEDVYEATRHRMTMAEENQKNKCTREIKPNQTDIGRKVKLKHTNNNRISNIPNNISTNKRDSYINNTTTNNSVSNNIINNNNINNNNVNNNNNNNVNNNNIINNSSLQTTPTSTASTTVIGSNNVNNNNNNNSSTVSLSLSSANKINNNNNSSSLQNQQQQQQQQINSTIIQNSSVIGNTNGNSLISGIGSSGTSSVGGIVPSRIANNNNNINRNQLSNNNVNNNNNNNSNNNNNNGSRGNTDIMKRPIKERLIHLLALRPYKKPELYARICSDGVRDREKNCISNVLKSVSFMRDNTYHLHRHIWNDVHEDWPFYTEQDRQCLKRRKPQNLTPPLSSDGGSSTSGQSPTSTHNGSPPPAVKRPPLINDKHMEGPAIKKQRVSHFRKEINNDNNSSSNRRGVTDSRDTSNMNPRSRESDECRSSSTYYSSNVTPNAQESEDSGLSLSYSVLGNDAAKRISTSSLGDNDTEKDHYEDDVNGSDVANNIVEVSRKEHSVSALTSGNKLNGPVHDFSEFSNISSVEQRRTYKIEFDKDYAEYRKLHSDIEEVSRRFAQLEERLRNEAPNNRQYKAIQKEILLEYRETMQDTRHQESKKRFQYLHQKLSHIKRLVNDFDSSITNGLVPQENY